MYQILYTDEDPAMLASKVGQMLKDGWEPLGGVAVTESVHIRERPTSHVVKHTDINYHRVWAQAMILRK